MINLALKNGRSYKRWKKLVNAMLEKEPGNPKIHRLRVIHLYEADYNLILALQARKMVHRAEDNRLLHENLYGATAGRTAHDPVGIEEFVTEITRLSRKPCIKNAEDATACYDSILPGVGNLAKLAISQTLQSRWWHPKWINKGNNEYDSMALYSPRKTRRIILEIVETSPGHLFDKWNTA